MRHGWRTEVAYFRYCPSIRRWRALMGFLHVALALSLNVLLYLFIHVSKEIDRLYGQFSFSVSVKKCEDMIEFSVCYLSSV